MICSLGSKGQEVEAPFIKTNTVVSKLCCKWNHPEIFKMLMPEPHPRHSDPTGMRNNLGFGIFKYVAKFVAGTGCGEEGQAAPES